jgi:hypothetical protein
MESESYKALLEVASRTKRQLEESQASYNGMKEQMEKLLNERKKLEENLQVSITDPTSLFITFLLIMGAYPVYSANIYI